MVEELDAEVMRRLGISAEAADQVVRAARPLWEALAALGLVDSYGSAEFERVLPLALGSIRSASNGGPA